MPAGLVMGKTITGLWRDLYPAIMGLWRPEPRAGRSIRTKRPGVKTREHVPRDDHPILFAIFVRVPPVRASGVVSRLGLIGLSRCTSNLRTFVMDFRGFDSSIIFNLRGGIPRPIGNFPESLSQAILVGIILVGRLGVPRHCAYRAVMLLFA